MFLYIIEQSAIFYERVKRFKVHNVNVFQRITVHSVNVFQRITVHNNVNVFQRITVQRVDVLFETLQFIIM